MKGHDFVSTGADEQVQASRRRGPGQETRHGHPTRAHDITPVANTMPSVALSVPSSLMT
jgi:hypothetical protein